MEEITIYKSQGFRQLESKGEQLKEIYFMYGVCMARMAMTDAFFILKLKFNKYEFEGEQVGKIYTEEEQQKIEFHHESATTGTLIKEFKATFDTTKFDGLFAEFKRIRDLLAHKYMRLNWSELSNRELREDIYDDLSGVFTFLNEFDESLKNQWFFTRANSAFGIRWTGGKQEPNK
jgi:hypothetical protein